jgi:DNA-binding FadR family transcriptional regulator
MMGAAMSGPTTKLAKTKIRAKPQQIADELRRRILAGDYEEGDLLGHEPGLIEQFGVSRPSMREALRILETEGLISVARGVQGGVIVHRPDKRLTARTAAIVLQYRNVSLADVFEARTILEPAAVRKIAKARNHEGFAATLRARIAEQRDAIDDPVRFAEANARFHEDLVAMAGNETLSIVVEMLGEVVTRAVAEVSRLEVEGGSTATRRRGVRSQEHLADLIEAGDAEAAEQHWQTHMGVVGKVMLGQRAKTVVDLLDHL